MAFPAPIVALYYTSVTGKTVALQGDPSGVRVNIVEGIDELPVVREADEVIPFRPGRLRIAAIADRRAIVLAGYVKAASDDQYRAMIHALQRALDPTIGPGGLTAILEDGGTRTITAQPRNIVYQGRIRTGRHLSIEFDAEPYWRGPPWGDAWTMDMGLYMEEDLLMDQPVGPMTFVPGGSPAPVTFVALGTTPTLDPIVQVEGPSSGSITVYNADGFGFGYPPLTGGQVLVVDCGARTAKIAGVSVRNALTFFAANPHGDFFRLRTGIETVTVTGNPARVTVLFSPTYL